MKLFLESLASQGIQLWVEGDKLRIKAPEGALDADQINTLKQRKPDIIEHLQQQESSVKDSLNGKPLSFSQKSYWSLYCLSPTNPAFNLQYACQLPSDINEKALSLACYLVSKRHDKLSTIFYEK